MLKISKILSKEAESDSEAAPLRSRRIRGLPPLYLTPLAGNRRSRGARSSSVPASGAIAPPTSPASSRPLYLNSRRESVIVHSNPNSGPSTPLSCEWDNYSEEPSFWNSRFGWLHQPHQIQLVDTETESSVEFDADLFGG